MPTKPGGYYNAKGQRVPSVTTVISRFKDSGALIHWANTIAYEPYRETRALLQRIVEQGSLSPETVVESKVILSKPENHCDYRVVRDSAAGIGTIVHARVDSHVRGRPFDPALYVSAEVPDPIAISDTGFSAFLEWSGNSQFKLVEGEMPLISNHHDFGGTPDVILVREKQTPGDFKTGDIYPEQVLPQLAAYEQLLIENGRRMDGGSHVVSINKKTGGFAHRFFTPDEMLKGWKVFTLMRQLYDEVKGLK